jgi:hypothetical protein
VQSRRPADFRPEKLRRCDADNRHRHSFDNDRSADGTSIAAETPLPEAMADDGHAALGFGQPVFVGSEGTSDERHHAEFVEEVAADEQPVNAIGFAACAKSRRE